jgi:hypothetical protein
VGRAGHSKKPVEAAVGAPVEVTPRRLWAGTAVAAVLAVVLLVMVLLPAGHGVDPVGTGAFFGFLPEQEPMDEGPQVAFRIDTHEVVVPAGSWVEFKLYLREGDSFEYEWSAASVLSFEFHGEPDGGAEDEFEVHKRGSAGADLGALQAPFSGTHGWYWQNPADVDVRVTLETTGTYAVVGVLDEDSHPA